MRIAITTAGNTLSAPIDSRFGRAPKFLIYDTDFGTYHIKDNVQNLNAAQGAGIQSALNLKKENVDCVITGNCGPKAYATLDAAEVAVYTCKEGTIKAALDQFKYGKLNKAQEANVEAHWV
jgi:predicted Fe-Mo cluster-binding NifX family protein